MEVDLGDLTFIDSGGVHLLLRAIEHAETLGRRLAFLPGSERVHRVLRIAGVEGKLRFRQTGGSLDAGRSDVLVPVLAVVEAVNTGDLSSIDRYVSDDALVLGSSTEHRRGVQAVREGIAELRTAFPDLRADLERAVALPDGDVLWEWTFRGTHAGGPYLGEPPRGVHASLSGVSIAQVEDGKVVRVRAYADRLALLHQLRAQA